MRVFVTGSTGFVGSAVVDDLLAHGHTVLGLTRSDTVDTTNVIAVTRAASEPVCLDFANKGVRTSVIRLAPTTHGNGSSGFTGMLVRNALQKGVAAYVGDGSNRWSAVHVADAARLYRLAMEKAAPGSIYHAIAQEGVAVKDIVTRVGQELGLPVKSIPADKAQEHFDWFIFAMMADNPASSDKTKEELGWAPTHGTVLDSVKGIVDWAKAQAAENAH
ncbi:hypothetical protein LLEC1_04239 [Akanthomyces lecanii]|uniref:NAD-dependent epimerase/dehydratase domain-containing protein n=1 Tax=Cordyceps confragosa TaxID=2714763 RepID=A0A179I439_CORDF|nr:hypothetical protein LLEC1_04239 [Akanthomyces lecanii]